jgi:hypothetical protein
MQTTDIIVRAENRGTAYFVGPKILTTDVNGVMVPTREYELVCILPPDLQRAHDVANPDRFCLTWFNGEANNSVNAWSHYPEVLQKLYQDFGDQILSGKHVKIYSSY